MAVRIQKVTVENLGPITAAEFDFRQLNLVYGGNERGKTFLVEFILRSLFKDLSDWNLRSQQGRGQVILSGLQNGSVAFSPASRSKLESFLDSSMPGLPAKMSRLLVVKGAELGMDQKFHGGANRDIVRGYLSGQPTIDAIQNNISKTIQGASIQDGTILGNNQGEIRNLRDKELRLKRYDKLFEEIDRHYSRGGRQVLQDQLDKLLYEKKALTDAKYQLAHNLDERKTSLAGELERLPEGDLQDLEFKIAEYLTIERQLAKNEDELVNLTLDKDNYRWLEEAVDIYEGSLTADQVKANPLFLALTLIILLLAMFTELIDIAILPGVLALLAILPGYLYIRQLRKVTMNTPVREEMSKLETEYQRRFGEPLSGLPLMQERKKQLEERYYRAQTLSEQNDSSLQELHRLQRPIDAHFQTLIGQPLAPSEWDGMAKTLVSRRNELAKLMNGLERELFQLQVDPADYRVEPAEVEYDALHLESIENRATQIQYEIQDEERTLDNLKQQICAQTGDTITVEWETLTEHLKSTRDKEAVELRALNSQIVAKICLNELLADFRAQEDEKIKEKLESAAVRKALHTITKRYESYILDGDDLLVQDPLGSFKLADLSTGAREQALLALRLGISAHLLKGKQLFLILDDAFQHSDWLRREALVDLAVELAVQGWQLLYFTMDDHLRDLFKQKGGDRLGPDYHEIVLKENSPA